MEENATETLNLPYGTANLRRNDKVIYGTQVLIGDRLVVIYYIGPRIGRDEYFIHQHSGKKEVRSLWPLRMRPSRSVPTTVTWECSWESIDDSEKKEVLEIYKMFPKKAA